MPVEKVYGFPGAVRLFSGKNHVVKESFDFQKIFRLKKRFPNLEGLLLGSSEL